MPRRNVYRNLGNHKLIVDSAELIGRSILKTGHFSRDLLQSMIEYLTCTDALPADSVFVDVGANIGTHSIYASLTGRFRNLVCIEPDPANFELLAANIALNGLGSRATLLNAGAGEQEGHLRLYRVDQNGGASTLVTPTNGAVRNAVDVKIRRLDDVLDQLGIAPERIGLMWIDTEGFEPAVWKGMPRLLAARPNIVLEFSPRIYGAAATRAFCAEIAYKYHRIMGFEAGKLIDFTPERLADMSDQTDLLLARSSV